MSWTCSVLTVVAVCLWLAVVAVVLWLASSPSSLVSPGGLVSHRLGCWLPWKLCRFVEVVTLLVVLTVLIFRSLPPMLWTSCFRLRFVFLKSACC